MADLRKLLTRIDKYYSRKCHMRMLRFLAQAVVPYEQLKNCESVLEVYHKIVDSRLLSDEASAAALLRYMLRVTGYERKDELKQLDSHCAENFEFLSYVPLLPFYECLLVLSSKLLNGAERFEHFLSSVDENQLSMSKLDVSSSPIDLFQSMIYEGTLDPKNLYTLIEKVVPLLKECGLTDEAEFIQNRFPHGRLHCQLNNVSETTSPFLSCRKLSKCKCDIVLLL